MILKQVDLDDMSEGGGVDCEGMCFKFGKCIETCEKITGAMANSTGFPCIAAGLCPEVDEFGEVSCKFSYKSMGCARRRTAPQNPRRAVARRLPLATWSRLVAAHVAHRLLSRVLACRRPSERVRVQIPQVRAQGQLPQVEKDGQDDVGAGARHIWEAWEGDVGGDVRERGAERRTQGAWCTRRG